MPLYRTLSLSFILLFSILLATSCTKKITEGNASGPVIEVDGEQVRHGIWVETFEDGTRKSHGRYTRGIKTGLHRTWHPSGQIATERRYDWEGHLHEKQVDFNEDGELIAKRFFEHDEEILDEQEEDEESTEDAVEEEEKTDEPEPPTDAPLIETPKPAAE